MALAWAATLGMYAATVGVGLGHEALVGPGLAACVLGAAAAVVAMVRERGI